MAEPNLTHNPQYDLLRQVGYDFVTKDLGLNPGPIDNIAIITPLQALHMRAQHGETWGGGYNPEGNNAVVVHDINEPDRPITGKTMLAARVVHEATHMATANVDEHPFYNEALPGIAEYKYLDRLRLSNRYTPATDYYLERAGVSLWIPNNWRYLHEPESKGTEKSGTVGKTSQGLIAALGIAYTLQKSGITSSDILAASTPRGIAQFTLMKSSLNSLKLGLSREVEGFDGTTDGIIQATSVIAIEVAKQNQHK
jgi:hypothetical protein